MIGARIFPFLAIALVGINNRNAENKQKIDAAIKRYWDAAQLPRKQKKRERKLANQDYQFWKGLQRWDEEFMNGKLTF